MKGTHQRARALLDSIGSTIDTHTIVGDLSASEMQMVEITKALSFDSKLIIMDEPSSSLTAEELKKLGGIIKDLRSRGISIIYISHKLDEIFDYCDIVTIMRDGHVIDTKPIGELTRSEMIAKMVGRTIDNEYPLRASFVGEPLLEVKNLNTNKLHDISFTLHKGEILGLVGLVGAGRTEIVRAIYGADKVRGHEMTLNGEKLRVRTPHDAKQAGMALVPEGRRVFLQMSVQENLDMGAFSRRGGNIDADMERVFEQFPRLKERRKQVAGTLSGGEQQMLAMGRALMSNPKLLMLDEPSMGLAPILVEQIFDIIKNLHKAGTTILLVEQNAQAALSVADRGYVLETGKIVTTGTGAELLASPAIKKAYLGG